MDHDTLLSFYTLYFNSCKRNRIVERNVLFSISLKNEIKKIYNAQHFFA